MDRSTLWLGIGFAGQALFSLRFLVQWLSSERAKKSVIPVAFWYFSLAGGCTQQKGHGDMEHYVEDVVPRCILTPEPPL